MRKSCAMCGVNGVKRSVHRSETPSCAMLTFPIKQPNDMALEMLVNRWEQSTRIRISSSPFKTCGRRFNHFTRIFSHSSVEDCTINTVMTLCVPMVQFRLTFSATCGRKIGETSSTSLNHSPKHRTSPEKWWSKATRPRRFSKRPKSFSRLSDCHQCRPSSGAIQLFKSPTTCIHNALHQLGTFAI